MYDGRQPLCAWTGTDANGEAFAACDRRATSAVVAHGGRRIYSCDEHLASAKARAQSGELETGLGRARTRPARGTAEVYLALA